MLDEFNYNCIWQRLMNLTIIELKTLFYYWLIKIVTDNDSAIKQGSFFIW